MLIDILLLRFCCSICRRSRAKPESSSLFPSLVADFPGLKFSGSSCRITRGQRPDQNSKKLLSMLGDNNDDKERGRFGKRGTQSLGSETVRGRQQGIYRLIYDFEEKEGSISLGIWSFQAVCVRSWGDDKPGWLCHHLWGVVGVARGRDGGERESE